jgi:hypothetical protein
MPKLSDVDPGIIYAMFKGEPGTRKSTQALSFPGRQYWFSWDRKMQGIQLPMKLWGINPDLVDYDDYHDWNAAKAKLEKFQVECPYDLLVFDSVTSCADMVLRQTLDLKVGMTRGSGQAAGMKIAGIAINEIEDYNAESSALNELIALTKDIQDYKRKRGEPLTIILIAHIMDVSKMINGKMVASRTIVTAGKRVAAKLPAYCSEVYHFGVETAIIEGSSGDLVVRTQHNGYDFARTSLNLPAEIKFGDSPLYSGWIKPAIAKMREKPNPLREI